MKKVISILLSVCILQLVFSCTSSREISYDESVKYQKVSEYIVLHTPEKLYALHNYEFNENYLKGDLKKFKASNKFLIHVYTKYNPELIMDKSSSVPLELNKKYIDSINYQKTSFILSALTALAIITGVFFIIGIATLDISPTFSHGI